MGLEWIHLAQNTVQALALVGHVNESPGFLFGWKWLYLLSNCKLLMKDSVYGIVMNHGQV
jgi:hypothetical protein